MRRETWLSCVSHFDLGAGLGVNGAGEGPTPPVLDVKGRTTPRDPALPT